MHKAVSYAMVLVVGMLACGNGRTSGAERPMARRAASDGLVSWWRFDDDQTNSVTDSVVGIRDGLSGNFRYVAGVRGKCIRMDGYTTGILRKAANVPRLTDGLTIETWVAPQTYPWNWTPIVNQGGEIIPPNVEPPAKVDLNHLKPGLAGVVYGEPDLSDPQSKVELVSTDSDWTGGANTWSARWRGYLQGPATGIVAFEAEADNGLRLRVNNQLIIDGWGLDKTRAGTMPMVKGEKYPIVLEYTQDHGPSILRLHWRWEGQPKSLIPGSALGYSPQDEQAARDEIVPPEPPPVRRKPRLFFGLDAAGRLALKLEIAGILRECISGEPLPLLKWSQVAGTFDRERGLALFINGKAAGALPVKGQLTPPEGGEVMLGRNIEKMGPANSERKPSADWPSDMVFDGLLDEVKIFDRALSADQIAQIWSDTRPALEQPLQWQKLPAGPQELPDRFAAVYCRLRYDELWENPWRVSDKADILVHFDESPVRLLFWRGTSYGGAWVTENGRWMGDQSLERAGGGKSRWGCAEHMSDKQTRYSHVSIVAQSDARIVLHWRYAISDIAYEIFAAPSPADWGEWTDEFYVIYPDAVSTRHQTLWTDHLSHEWQETIVLNQPGTRPEDNIDLEAMTVANMNGESKTYSWTDKPPPKFSEPADITIQMVNLKSRYKPFIIFEPGPEIKPFTGAIHREYSRFPWWNHWPVGQLPNDGRVAFAPDRPSHSSLSQSIEDSKVIHKTGDRSYTVVTLIGLTDQPAASLALLARSWNNAPRLALAGHNFSGGGYDKYQRAFLLEKTTAGKPESLEFTVEASAAAPLLNPAFVIRNWGESGVQVMVNGKPIARSTALRIGHEHRLEGTDLVVWMKMQAAEPLTITLKPAAP